MWQKKKKRKASKTTLKPLILDFIMLNAERMKSTRVFIFEPKTTVPFYVSIQGTTENCVLNAFPQKQAIFLQ